MRKSIRKAISIILTAAIMLPGTGTVRAAEIVTQSDENEDSFVQSCEEEADNAHFDDQGENLLSPTGTGDVSKIHNPRTSGDVSTWDCIWFGNYWQEDTNGDGKCYAEETKVEGTTYPADKKQPIKWRVLDIDDNGNALLLADKLIDIVQYNETRMDVTWEKCTMRSYLNGYDGSKNDCKKDFSEQSANRSFVYSAFNDDEIKSLIESEVKNPDNPVYKTAGGNTTYDRLFCLSLEEAMIEDYGFIKNDFTNPPEQEKQWYTDDDPTRVAVTTKFTDDKPGYGGSTAGEPDWWWLRSPGYIRDQPSYVDYNGAAHAYSNYLVNNSTHCVRPAFRMNLSSSSSLWKYAGTVSSDGTVNIAVDNVKRPQTTDSGVSTWDCIWFGNYWQDTDSDGDGKVTQKDEKDPIKWRVLNVDPAGNALLLSDKLIDIVEYNHTYSSVTWETCTLRSFLNNYGPSSNSCGRDYSSDGFLGNAFSIPERNAILTERVVNDDNPVYGTGGGKDTFDKVFCLSLAEALKPDYGFIKNDLSYGGDYTDADPARTAVTTRYTAGFWGSQAGGSEYWWLRSLGNYGYGATYVYDDGRANADIYPVNVYVCVRPAFRLNLSSSSSLWTYAGTVSSDGTVVELVAVAGVSLSENAMVSVGKTITLTPEISPANATDKTVTWKSSAEGVAAVSDGGVVTGVTEGTADITVTTNDGGYTATCRVTVSKEGTDPGPDPSEEDLKKDIDVDTADRKFDMLPGEARRLKINKTGKYVYGVSYVSDDPKTVSVKNGVVTAKKLKKGEMKKKVTVTAAYNGESVPFVITVKASLPSIEAGQKGRKITAPKTVKASAGTSKTVTAAVKLPKALHGKEVRAKVVIPEKLPGTSVSDGNTENDFFDLGEGKPDAKGTKVSFAITPREAGAAYIVWTVTDESGNRSQAYTKVLIKKPLSTLSVNCPETGLDLSVGEGQRLIVTTTKGNTDTKDLSFSVKGRGVKVSKSGFVTAVTPGAKADVTVKAGKYKGKITVRAKDHAGSILALNKTSVNVKRPKEGAKPKTAALKVTMPKKNPPEVKWSIKDSPKGIAVDPDGKITVTSDASPGCYTVTAAPKDTGSAYNPVCCEVIIR